MKQIKIAAILIFLSIALFSDTVTLKNGKVISNVKATVTPLILIQRVQLPVMAAFCAGAPGSAVC